MFTLISLKYRQNVLTTSFKNVHPSKDMKRDVFERQKRPWNVYSQVYVCLLDENIEGSLSLKTVNKFHHSATYQH